MGNANRIKKLELYGEEIQNYLRNVKYTQGNEEQHILRNITKSIDETVDKLKNKKYTVAVIAAMKAGKSTLFNALLGRDILPNETAACTAAITEVKFSENTSDKVLKYMQDGSVEKLQATKDQDLAEVFLEDVRSSRKGDSVSNIDKYYFEYPIYALKDEKYQGIVENFVLVDTPGPNEADTGEFDVSYLKALTEQQIRSADAVIFIFDYKVYKSDTNAKLLKDIFAYRNMEESERNKIFFVLNKIDAMTSKDPDLDTIIDSVRKMIKVSTENKIPNPQVLPVSALKALFARQLEDPNISSEVRKEIYTTFLGDYAIEDGNGNYKQPKNYKQLLLKDSKIENLEQKVIVDTFEKSSDHLIEQSKGNLINNLQYLGEDIYSKKKLFEQDAAVLSKNILRAQQEVLELKEEQKPIQEQVKFGIRQYKQSINEQMKQAQEDIASVIADVPVEDVYTSNSQDEIKEIHNRIINDYIQTISNYLETYQYNLQNITRKYLNEINQKLIFGFKELAKKANKLIGEELNFSISTAGNINFTQDFSLLDDLTTAIESKIIEGQKGGIIDRAFDGIKGAARGLIEGFKDNGIIGGVEGFFKGLIKGSSGEERQYQTRKKEYILKIEPLKVKVLKSTTEYLKQDEQAQQKEIDKLLKEINNDVERNINKFLQSVNQQLNSLEKEYKDNQLEKEKMLMMYDEEYNKIIDLTMKINSI